MIKVARTSRKRERDSERQKHEEQGKKDGKDWVAKAHPVAVRQLLTCLGNWQPRYQGDAWNYCPSTCPDIRMKFMTASREYAHAFLTEVKNQFLALDSVLIFVRHLDGVEDGKRWAAEFASAEQLDRLRTFAADEEQRPFFTHWNWFEFEWTPAHHLVAYLLADDYPVDDQGELSIDCPAFCDFWQPFISESLVEVLSELEQLAGRHKLQDRNYVTGFIDGALGLSEQFRERLDDPSPRRQHD